MSKDYWKRNARLGIEHLVEIPDDAIIILQTKLTDFMEESEDGDKV